MAAEALSGTAERHVQVAVDLPVPGTFTYCVGPALAERAVPGTRVLVEFGGRASVALVVGDAEPPDEPVRPVRAALDSEPLVRPDLLELCLWMARYYGAPPGEAIRLALPPGTRIGARLLVRLTEAGRAALGGGSGAALPRGQRLALAGLAEAGGEMPRGAATRLSGVKAADIDAAAEGGLLEIAAEAGRARVNERTERVARLARELEPADLEALGRARVRRQVLEAIVDAGGELALAALRPRFKNAAGHLRRLAADGYLEIEERPLRRAARAGGELPGAAEAPELNVHQRRALDAVLGGAAEGAEFRGYLLHGVTGSGKTEVYLQAIDAVTQEGRGAIVLVPEISLTPQLAARFRARFGERVAVLHSGLTPRERFDEWHRLHCGEADIALGARSAVFAPLGKPLGIIVVDEEHDSSFKQEEGVRYHARDVALVRAKRAGAVAVLGSATPSLESLAGTRAGRLELLELPERATAGQLPEVELIDLRRYRPDGATMLTAPLAEAVAENLAAGGQTILFLNRRGWSTFVLCVSCGEAVRCPHCAVSLTYHRALGRVLCHYCGYGRPLPESCAGCGAQGSISRRGLGTEQIADAVSRRFSSARVARLDRDVASGATVEKVLGRVARREIDILVGTQMVTKGHDFPGVTLVGVLCADTGLSLPDFRASERTFQLLSQVAGRAGRGEHAGRVLIQSYRTEHVAIQAARDHDYRAFSDAELESRRELGYPPWGHLIAVRFDGPDGAAVAARARRLAERIRGPAAELEVAVLGPAEAPLARLRGRTRWHLWLRGPRRPALRRLLGALAPELASRTDKVRVTVDVDPVSAL